MDPIGYGGACSGLHGHVESQGHDSTQINLAPWPSYNSGIIPGQNSCV